MHPHVIAAVFLGAALTLSPVYLCFHAGSALTRHVNAVAQMLWSALLIHARRLGCAPKGCDPFA